MLDTIGKVNVVLGPIVMGGVGSDSTWNLPPLPMHVHSNLNFLPIDSTDGVEIFTNDID